MEKLSKAAMKRLVESEFFNEVLCVVKAVDYYLLECSLYRGKNKHDETVAQYTADEMMRKWNIAKLALKHITGNTYRFSRDGEGNYSVVNERDSSDKIITGRNEYKKVGAA